MIRFLPLLFLCACARELENDAQVCLGEPSDSDPIAQVVADGESLTLFVTAFAGCHTADLQVSCDATLDGDTIHVTTLTSWVRTEPLATGCEAVLLSASGSCSVGPLDAGTYVVDYDGATREIVIPGEFTTECLPVSSFVF